MAVFFSFLRFLPRTFDPRWLRRLSSALLEQQPAAHDDAAEFARRRSRVIFFCGRPLRDHPLNNILLQLLHICSAAAGDVRQRTNVHSAADLRRRLRHVQQGRPGREARPTAHIHRPHRRFRLAPAHSRAGCRFLAPPPLLAGMRPSGRGQPRVDRRPALDRRQGGSARMLVHVSERCMGQERAREGHHV